MTMKKNQKYIVRSDRAGVFYGEIESKNLQNVVMRNVRRLWYWEGACSISQIALEGVKKSHNCRFSVTVEQIEFFDVIEIIPCTDEACKSIDAVEVWKI